MRAWRRTSGRGCCWASEPASASASEARGAALLRLAHLSVTLSLTVCALACTGRSTDPITVVSVQETTPPTEGALDPARAEVWAGEALAGIGGLKVRAAAPGERRLQAVVRVGRRVYRGARPEDGGLVPPDRLFREVEAALEIRALDPAARRPPGSPPVRLGNMRYTGLGRAAENVGVFDGDAELVERAIADAARDLALVIDLEVVPDAEVIARLGRGDVRSRARAIEAAAGRQLSGAVEALVALVAEPTLGPRATGALVAIGDARAVPALIESARQQPLVSVVFAVAEIGGKEAQAWLFTLSSGHPEPAIRAAAQEALDELEERAARRQQVRGAGAAP